MHTPTRSSIPMPRTNVSGLPTRDDNHTYSSDIRMETAKGLPATNSYADVRMGTAKAFTLNHDITMDTARGGTTLKQGGLQLWERELLDSSEVKRKATVAQLCEIHVVSETADTQQRKISWITTFRLWDTSPLARNDALNSTAIRPPAI